jgi:hypothetical protein
MKPLFIPFIALCVLTSCQHIYYAPNTSNAPLFSEKGETRINGLYSTGGDSEYDGAELQFAHAISKNAGIMANAFTASKSEIISDYSGGGSHTETGKGSYIEFGAGFFKALDIQQKWITEAYGGIGFGSATNVYSFKDESKVGITKIFIQPSIGYKSNYFEFAVVPKISLVNWKVKSERITSPENQDNLDELNAIRSDQAFVAFEPAFLLRGGGKAMKVQLGLSVSGFKTSNMFYSTDLAETVNLSLGVSVNIKPKKK